MSDVKRYGGIGIPLDIFNKAANEMQRTDDYRMPRGHYSWLLDTALQSIWPGTEPMKVKDFKVSVA